MMKHNALPETVGIEEFAELIGISTRRVGQMVAEGHVVRTARGKVALAPSIQGMIAAARSEREPAPLSAARARGADARAALAEMRMAREIGSLIPVEVALGVVDRIGGLFVAALSGLPARATRDLVIRREIDRHCDALRNEIVVAIEQIRAENRVNSPYTKDWTDAQMPCRTAPPATKPAQPR